MKLTTNCVWMKYYASYSQIVEKNKANWYLSVDMFISFTCFIYPLTNSIFILFSLNCPNFYSIVLPRVSITCIYILTCHTMNTVD